MKQQGNSGNAFKSSAHASFNSANDTNYSSSNSEVASSPHDSNAYKSAAESAIAIASAAYARQGFAGGNSGAGASSSGSSSSPVGAVYLYAEDDAVSLRNKVAGARQASKLTRNAAMVDMDGDFTAPAPWPISPSKQSNEVSMVSEMASNDSTIKQRRSLSGGTGRQSRPSSTDYQQEESKQQLTLPKIKSNAGAAAAAAKSKSSQKR
jgi:hypothetical protein